VVGPRKQNVSDLRPRKFAEQSKHRKGRHIGDEHNCSRASLVGIGLGGGRTVQIAAAVVHIAVVVVVDSCSLAKVVEAVVCCNPDLRSTAGSDMVKVVVTEMVSSGKTADCKEGRTGRQDTVGKVVRTY